MVNIISEVSKEKLFKLIDEKTRVDNRNFEEYREITIKTGYIGKADGSALVSIGNTTIVAGVKAQLTTPFSNSPDEGIIITNTELLSIASSNFEYGPPNKFAVEISRVVDRTIREAPVVDLKNLCIIEGKEVWKLHIDLHLIDFDGNIMDAASLAAISALIDTKIPSVSSINGEVVLDEENLIKIPIKNRSVLCTVFKLNNQLLLDANSAEENLMDCSLSIGFREDGTLCALQKSGLNSFTLNEVKKAVNIAYEKCDKLFYILDKIES